MATATASSYSVVTLGEAAQEAAERGFGLGGPPAPEDGRRGRVALRRDLDIGSFGLYREKDYEGALAILRTALEAHPGNALILYNIACMESCLRHADAVWEPLAESLAAWPAYKELAVKDEDLEPLRDDPRFQAL